MDKKNELSWLRLVFIKKAIRQLGFLILQEEPYGCRILYKYYIQGPSSLEVYVVKNSRIREGTAANA